jgi:hypothetical protein
MRGERKERQPSARAVRTGAGGRVAVRHPPARRRARRWRLAGCGGSRTGRAGRAAAGLSRSADGTADPRSDRRIGGSVRSGGGDRFLHSIDPETRLKSNALHATMTSDTIQRVGHRLTHCGYGLGRCCAQTHMVTCNITTTYRFRYTAPVVEPAREPAPSKVEKLA